MSTAVWTTLAVGGMLAIFAGCVVVVVAGIRVFEMTREKRRRKQSA